jgi:ABC-type glutathione transport system ATPase component
MLLEIRNLSVKFRVGKEYLEAVKNVSLELEEKMALGIVGESGSGKSTICLSILRLLPETAFITGEILYQGKIYFSFLKKNYKKLEVNI